MNNHTKCPHCGASLKSSWHAITPGLVMVLVKVYKEISQSGENSIQMKDLNLDHSEYGNFQKLRFHGLIAKDDSNPKHWLITKRGADFLKNKIAISRRVETFRNKVMGHDTECVSVRDVMRSDPYWQKVFEGKPQQIIPVDYTITGQGVLI